MKFIIRSSLVAVAFALPVLVQPAFSAEKAAAAATVNGKVIKQSLVDYLEKDATARGQKVDDNLRMIIVKKLIASELVYQEAQKLGLDKQSEFVAREELGRRELLVNTFIADYIKKNPVSEADTKAAYEQYKKELGEKEYSARHILVATEAEAKEIITQLGKSGDFAKVAKEKSKDPGSKDKGGDLGWFSPAGMVKPFSDAVVALKKGETTAQPVQTQFGWHVIKLEDIRDTQPPAYDKVKEGLQKTLQQRQLEKMVDDLRNKAKIVEGGAAASVAKKK